MPADIESSQTQSHLAVRGPWGTAHLKTGGTTVFANKTASWYHSNQYNAQSACEHCGGVVRHEHWCITRDLEVQYAYAAVLDHSKLTLRDRLILHALGVAWAKSECKGTCKKA